MLNKNAIAALTLLWRYIINIYMLRMQLFLGFGNILSAESQTAGKLFLAFFIVHFLIGFRNKVEDILSLFRYINEITSAGAEFKGVLLTVIYLFYVFVYTLSEQFGCNPLRKL